MRARAITRRTAASRAGFRPVEPYPHRTMGRGRRAIVYRSGSRLFRRVNPAMRPRSATGVPDPKSQPILRECPGCPAAFGALKQPIVALGTRFSYSCGSPLAWDLATCRGHSVVDPRSEVPLLVRSGHPPTTAIGGTGSGRRTPTYIPADRLRQSCRTSNRRQRRRGSTGR